jgi:lysozyme family protein
MAAENYKACLSFVLRFEGGRSDDPKDPGGRTLNGVTQTRYDQYREEKRLGRRDVYLMTTDERDEIYRSGYWVPIRGDRLRSGEDLVVFDYGVNSGPRRALSALRRAGIGDASAETVVHRLCAERLSFLHGLRTWSHFGSGWGRRVAACEALAVMMLHGVDSEKILGDKAKQASAAGRKHMAKGAIGGAAASQGDLIHHASGGHMALTIAIGVIIAIGIGIVAWQAWRQSQRAAAFKEAAQR